MGILGVDQNDPTVAGGVVLPDLEERTGAGVTRLFEYLMDVGIDGRGRFSSARTVADLAMAEHSETERAVDAIVRSHLKLAAANGFVTGLGGFATMVIALPANVLGFYLVATRMVAGIASTRGFDIDEPNVRSAILLALVGADSDDLLTKLSPLPGVGTGGLAAFAAQRLPGPVLLAVNKAVGFRLLNQVGKKSLTRIGRAVPVAGGVVGAGVDAYLLNRIGDHARHEFPPTARQGFRSL